MQPKTFEGFIVSAVNGYLIQLDTLGNQAERLRTEMRQTVAKLIEWPEQEATHLGLFLGKDNKITAFDTRTHQAIQQGVVPLPKDNDESPS